jgi:hypothetical protein
MPEIGTLWKRVGLHSAIFRYAALQPLGLALTLRAKWPWSAKDRLRFKAIGKGFLPSAETGEVLNMSSKGVAFRADEKFHLGMPINRFLSQECN